MQDQKLVINYFNLQLGVVLGRLDIIKGKNCLQEAVDYRDRPFVAAQLLSHLLEVKVPLHVVNGVVVFLSANFVDAEDLELEVQEVIRDFECLFSGTLEIVDFQHFINYLCAKLREI